jgi:hypothetical protein
VSAGPDKENGIMRTVLIALAALACAGCTSSAERQREADMDRDVAAYNAAQTSADKKVVCEMEAVTGTRMKQKVCRTVSEMERDEEDAERMLKDRQPAPPTSN